METNIYFHKFIIIMLIYSNFYFFIKWKYSSDDFEINLNQEKIEDIDSNILFQIQKKLNGNIEFAFEDQKFLNGLIRKFKPKKIVEIGVSAGGSSSLILNAIKDIPNSKLYSFDRYNEWYRNRSKKVGWLVKEKFPDLMDKWSLYTGINTAEYIETIGNKIDFVFIDTVHFTPGEMLNWLEILPFLKEGAIVAIHDTFFMFIKRMITIDIKNFSNNQLLCYIRGSLILPSYGKKIFSRNIGALKLAKNQKQYYKQYFLALGNQWQYFPNEEDLEKLRKHFNKYYGEQLVEIYNDAIEKNKIRANYNKTKLKHKN